MLVNNNMESQHVKFISYTGEYPNLCSGTLTLEIDGIEYTFGGGYKEPKTDFRRFWSSGGSVWFDDDISSESNEDENEEIYNLMKLIGKKRGAIVSGGNVDEEKVVVRKNSSSSSRDKFTCL